MRHFRHYLYGRHCDVFTDHESLKSLLKTPQPSGRLARWGLVLQEVDLATHYKQGKRNVLADALSRAPLSTENEFPLVPAENLVTMVMEPQDSSKSGESNLCARQMKDPDLNQIMNYLENSTLPTEEKKARDLVLAREQYVLIEGVLHYMSKDKTLRLIPPEEDRHQLFDEVHGGMFCGHLRKAKIFEELAKRYW